MERKKQESGFTLIELLIVIAIIGILSAVALPFYNQYIARSQVKEAAVFGISAQPLITDFVHRNGSFPAIADLKELGLPVEADGTITSDRSGTIASVAIGAGEATDEGVMTLTLKDDLRPEVQGLQVAFIKHQWTAADQDATWSCEVTPADDTVWSDDLFLPKGCTNP